MSKASGVDHKSFLEDVKNHGMVIENNNGLHRCIYFGVPKNYNQHFRLITWPGHLAISGDMGDFVFSRTEDMFDFFRGECGKINTGYWGEKLTSISVFGGHKKFDWDGFFESFKEQLISSNSDVTEEAIISAIDENMLAIDEDEYGAVQLVRNWNDEEIVFESSDVIWRESLTYQYIWCLYAIVWGINKYDKQQAQGAV